jgi:hypothetical protein
VPPQWVELRFPSPVGVGAVRLRVSQRNGGPSVHELWIQRTGSQPERVHVFDGATNDGDVLVYQPDAPIAGVESVKVVTTSLAGGQFPAWQEIEVIAP